MYGLPHIFKSAEHPNLSSLAVIDRVLVPESTVYGVGVVVQFVRERVIKLGHCSPNAYQASEPVNQRTQVSPLAFWPCSPIDSKR